LDLTRCGGSLRCKTPAGKVREVKKGQSRQAFAALWLSLQKSALQVAQVTCVRSYGTTHVHCTSVRKLTTRLAGQCSTGGCPLLPSQSRQMRLGLCCSTARGQPQTPHGERAPPHRMPNSRAHPCASLEQLSQRHVLVVVFAHHLCNRHFEVFLCDVYTPLAQSIHPRLCADCLDLCTRCSWQLLCNFC